MRVLVVGAGGREHALAWRLARDPSVSKVVAAPGNPGIARDAACVPVAVDDVQGIIELVERERVDLTVVGPEVPLVAGLADELSVRGHAVFGPSKAAARIEGSKAWAKELCERHGIPAARSRTVRSMPEALDALDAFDAPYVVKADGLAAGKGVVIAQERVEAVRAFERALVDGAFGEAGASLVVEEHLVGSEVSAFALTDGRHVVPLALARDYKRAGDADTGLNTGGMGAFSPVPFVDEATEERIRTEVLERTVRAMADEGVPYRGVLYAGLMLTQDGPKVLEFNCRFGDPETQAIVPRLASDPAEAFLACATGGLAAVAVGLSDEAGVTVVLASGGYPDAYQTGFEISGIAAAEEVEGVTVFHAGTTERGGRVVTAGGRVLSVSAVGSSIGQARDRSYEACSRVAFEGKVHRWDVAAEAAEKERT
jgi:phosphoribosylamine---glycine ligase